MAVLPRGHYFGGNSGAGYSFPELVKPNGLKKLITAALEAFNARTGASVSQGKLILTAHSGGGAALMAILKYTDPDEVFTFDALYSDPAALIKWASRRHQAGSGVLRVIAVAVNQRPATACAWLKPCRPAGVLAGIPGGSHPDRPQRHPPPLRLAVTGRPRGRSGQRHGKGRHGKGRHGIGGHVR